jgi:molybdate transport system substrate-binding protein
VLIPRVLLPAILGAALVAAGCRSATEPPTHRGRVRVAAASDLNAALSDVIARFGGAHDVDVSVSYGSSGTFYAQLLNQAPFDLFLSADLDYPNQLSARGLTVPQSEFTYAVDHGGVILKWAADVDAARALRGFLLSADGRAILERSGFALPDR